MTATPCRELRVCSRDQKGDSSRLSPGRSLCSVSWTGSHQRARSGFDLQHIHRPESERPRRDCLRGRDVELLSGSGIDDGRHVHHHHGGPRHGQDARNDNWGYQMPPFLSRYQQIVRISFPRCLRMTEPAERDGSRFNGLQRRIGTRREIDLSISARSISCRDIDSRADGADASPVTVEHDVPDTLRYALVEERTTRLMSRAVAQWSEQGTHNPSVVGSIPTGPTSRSQGNVGFLNPSQIANPTDIPLCPTIWGTLPCVRGGLRQKAPGTWGCGVTRPVGTRSPVADANSARLSTEQAPGRGADLLNGLLAESDRPRGGEHFGHVRHLTAPNGLGVLAESTSRAPVSPSFGLKTSLKNRISQPLVIVPLIGSRRATLTGYTSAS